MSRRSHLHDPPTTWPRSDSVSPATKLRWEPMSTGSFNSSMWAWLKPRGSRAARFAIVCLCDCSPLFCLLQPWLRMHCNRYCTRRYLLVDTEWCGQSSKPCPKHSACTWKAQVMDALRRSCIQLIRSLRMHPQDRLLTSRLARPFRRRHLYHVLRLHLARRTRLPLPHRHRHKYRDPRCSG